MMRFAIIFSGGGIASGLWYIAEALFHVPNILDTTRYWNIFWVTLFVCGIMDIAEFIKRMRTK
jgi:hypothetical protein